MRQKTAILMAFLMLLQTPMNTAAATLRMTPLRMTASETAKPRTETPEPLRPTR